MQDAVAEILRERSAAPRGVTTSIVLSAALHIAMFAAFVAAASREPLPPQRSVVRMQLAAPAAARQIATPSPAVTSSPAPATPKPSPPPQPAPPQPKPAAVEPPTAAKPPKRTSAGESLFGRSELEPAKSKAAQPAPPASSQPAASPPSSGTSTAPLPAVGKAGVTALEGGPFPYSLYIDRMVKLIGDRWFRPDAGGEVLAQVYFVINRDGSVRDVKIEKSSGVASFDRAAYRAVLEASPLPPLPAAYSGTFLGVHLTFH